jgi:hypothetical protein
MELVYITWGNGLYVFKKAEIMAHMPQEYKLVALERGKAERRKAQNARRSTVADVAAAERRDEMIGTMGGTP